MNQASPEGERRHSSKSVSGSGTSTASGSRKELISRFAHVETLTGEKEVSRNSNSANSVGLGLNFSIPG